MLGRKPKRIRRPRRRVLEGLSEAFREIEAHFELLGFSSIEEEEPQAEKLETREQEAKKELAEEPEPEECEDEELDDRYGEEEIGPTFYDREEIEVSIDVFISELVRHELIQKPRPGSTLHIADVFERFFGEEHEIVKLTRDLDEHIEGYFGSIGYDDMTAAYERIVAIRGIIDREIHEHAQNDRRLDEDP